MAAVAQAEIFKFTHKSVTCEIKDSQELITNIRRLPPETVSAFQHPISLDVSNMYPSIPTEAAIKALSAKLKEDSFNYHGINWSDVEVLLRMVLGSTVFEFNGKFYRQKSGLPIGSRISGLLASLFMDEMEKKIVPELDITMYRRYVDDTFMMVRNRNEAQRILQVFNGMNQHVRFEMEEAKDGCLKLLDLSVSITTDGLKIGFYQKEARSDMFLNARSALPTTQKLQIVRNERERVATRCETKEDLNAEMRRLDRRLERNGFSGREIEATRKRPRRELGRGSVNCLLQ